MIVDMHMHSTASDGQYTPSEVVELVHQAGINLMALTDHDSVSGVAEARAKAKELGIKFITGIELSIAHEHEFHMLGYGLDIENEALRDFCAQLVHDRDTRADKIIDYLAEYGMIITRDEIEAMAGSDLIGRPHFARVMLQKGYVATMQEAFDKYLATDGFAKIERPKPTAMEGLKMIHDAGGKAVIAHPFSWKRDHQQFEAELIPLVENGLWGMEVYYSTHSPEEIDFYHSMAEKYGLVETTGSDFHGEKVKPTIFLGKKNGGGEILVDADEKLQLEKILGLAE